MKPLRSLSRLDLGNGRRRGGASSRHSPRLSHVAWVAWVAWAALAWVSAAAACRHLPKGCEKHETREACLFRLGAENDNHDDAPATDGPRSPDNVDPVYLTAEGWSAINQQIRDVAESMAAGLDARTIEEMVRQWCDDEPRSLDQRRASPTPPDPHNWICTLPIEERVSRTPIYLEHNQGAISISMPGLDEQGSAAALEGITKRWDRVCAERLTPLEREERAEELYACELDGGPQIVVGRFPRDLEANLWQVTLMLAP